MKRVARLLSTKGFLDHRTVEVAMAVPARWKVGWRGGKRIYRDTFHDLLPTQIWNQKKRGFDIPAAGWLRSRLRERAADVLLDDTSRGRGIIDSCQVERYWTEHQRGGADHSKKLWALLMLEIWIRNVERLKSTLDIAPGARFQQQEIRS